ncbi:hypothetical protein [Prochlorococcus marinus]|uniref:hypothetical protein n=1 Tax=Prochlorococcus marinus TaxID=1219 RepID=UPI001ADB4F65|nr:hypothetical protein [Prochlorococcus marinus]MBO8219523.1 hypothetical protein [Prochlorococcus marinus CUG1416]MBW3051894.1 hypothetical protein [Prochlorococcus marinus str. MU1416]
MNNKILKYNAIFLFLFSFIGIGVFLIYDFISSERENIITSAEKINNDSKNFNTAEEALINDGLGRDYSLNYYPDFATNIIDLKKNILPINGISNIKTYYCNEQGFLSNYFSDRHGFPNNDDVFESQKIDIALIGDSYLDGACTNKSSIQQNLSKQNKNLKIATFAQGGAGPLLSLALLKEYASEYKPNHVFWFWVGNDLRNLQDELQSPLRFYMREGYSQNLINPINKLNADKSVKEILQVYQQFNNQEDSKSLNKISKKNHNQKDIYSNTKNIIKNYFPKTFSLIKKIRKEKKIL